jgi:hypothetical protein
MFVCSLCNWPYGFCAITKFIIIIIVVVAISAIGPQAVESACE